MSGRELSGGAVRHEDVDCDEDLAEVNGGVLEDVNERFAAGLFVRGALAPEFLGWEQSLLQARGLEA